MILNVITNLIVPENLMLRFRIEKAPCI